MSVQTYPTYKDSGVAWLGEIPAHWELRKLALITKLGGGTTPKTDKQEYYLDGTHSWLNTGDLNDQEVLSSQKYITNKALDELSALKQHSPGTVVIALYGATIGKLGLVNFQTTVNQACCVLHPGYSLTQKYLFFVLLSAREYLLSLAVGGTQPNISQDTIASIRIPLPPLAEQEAIAAFLDRECARIDELVLAQQRMVALLREKRQAVIAHAVTRGLDPAVALRDSGVAWLGQVPAHWEVERLKNIFEIKKTIANSVEHDVLSVTQKGIKIKDISSNEGQLAESYAHYQLVNIGDFVMNHMDLISGYVDVSKYHGVTSPDYRVFTMRSHSNSADFLLRSLQVCYHEKLFFPYGQGSSQLGRWRLPTEGFQSFYFPLPPLSEQQAIALFLDTECRRIDSLIGKTEQAIALLQERRSAVIAAAVTGQIRVVD